MINVLVYNNKRELKKKLFQLLPLINGCNCYFLEDLKDFTEDFISIKPQYLILEETAFELLKKDQACLALMAKETRLIVIQKSHSEGIKESCNETNGAEILSAFQSFNSSFPDKKPVLLSPDFTINELSAVLIPSDLPEEKEANMRIENGFLQILMDNIPDTIYFKDTESRFTRINNAKARYLSIVDPRDAIGKTDSDFYDSAHAKKTFLDEQKLMKSGIPIINKLEHIKSGGDNRFVTATKIPVRDKDGNIVGLVGISRDVTLNKEHEEKLLREQNLLKALMNNIPDKIFFKDRQSKFIRVNRAWANKYNLTKTDEAIGKADSDFFPRAFAEETFREEQLLMQTGMPLINKLEKKVRDGKESYKLVTKVPIKGKNGIISGLVGISHDITGLKIAEKK